MTQKTSGNVIAADKLPKLRASLERLEAQRACMRIPDPHWRAMKRRARKSHQPIAVALERELDGYARLIQERLRREFSDS